MSFLNQLKSQASAVQQEQSALIEKSQADLRLTESASKLAWLYISDLAKQLNVIAPAGPSLTLDGKTPWPPMKLVGFHCDTRKRKLQDQEVYDYISMGWDIVPKDQQPVRASVSANFVPDFERIEKRISAGNVKYERCSVRLPEKGSHIRFDYTTQARGSLKITVDHENSLLLFRLACLKSFDVANLAVPVQLVQTELLDELAKLIVGESSTFLPEP